MKIKRMIAGLLAVLLVFSMTSCRKDKTPADEYDNTDIGVSIQEAGHYLYKKVKTPKYGDEDAVVALLRSDYIDFWDKIATEYMSSFNRFISKNMGYIGENEEIYYDKYPDVIFAVTAAGIYADRTSNADLIPGVSIDSVVLRGGYLNKIRALAAIECGNYKFSETGDLTYDALADFIISLQKEDGSFSYAGQRESDIYLTAQSIISLKLGLKDVTNPADALEAINRGVEFIESSINADMNFYDLVWSVISLNTREIDAAGNIETLLKYQNDDGSFSSDLNSEEGNKQDTAIALLALASQRRFDKKLNSLYDMTDVAGGTHNKVSPIIKLYIKLLIIFFFAFLVFMLIMRMVAKSRIKKWRKEGIYDEEKGIRMSDEDIAKMKAKENEQKATGEIDSENKTEETKENEIK
jgi:hypothetical protein